MSAICAGAFALLLLACGGDGEQPDTLVETDDPELREMAGELLPDLARRSGLELREPVRLARRSRGELVRYLEVKLDQDLPPDRAEWMTRSYALLGLVPEDLDLREILLAVYTEQVAGFYDPDSTALFVMEDQPPENLRTVLIHELVHAVQDQATPLDSLTAPDRGNDRQAAAQAAIEGHATVVMLEYLAELARGEPVDLSEIPDFADQVRPALQAMRGQYPALSGAPPVIQESLLFPYLEGASFVQALWQGREGRPPPFDEHLPRSSEQVLDPERLLGSPPDEPTEIRFEFQDREAVYENGLGEMEVRVLLRELVGASLEDDEPLGWDGDRYALFEPVEDEPAEEEMPEGEAGEAGASLAWFSVWDAPAARDAFVDDLSPELGALPAAATLERIEIEGRPGALLRVGDVPDLEIELEGGDEPGP